MDVAWAPALIVPLFLKPLLLKTLLELSSHLIMKKELFCNTPDADRITIPYTRPPRTFPPGSDSEPEEDIEEMWRRSRRHIKVFPDGEKPRTLSRASSVATYQGSEADFKWDDVCDEVDTDELKRDRALK